MSEVTVFVLRNQFEQYLDKHNGWQSGKDAQALFRCKHHDEALNTLIEVNAKDITLRGDILEVGLDEKGRPVVEVSEAAIELDKDLAKMEAENPSEPEQFEMTAASSDE